jgi:hypothetical protein
MLTQVDQSFPRSITLAQAGARKRVCVMRFHETILELLRKTAPIRQDNAHEPLPRRWVDLIHYLEEQERQERKQNGAGVKKLDS